MQGISSIGCTDVVISGNVIKNTVNAGICLFNSEDLYSGTNARVNNVKVLNNFLSNNGGPLNIDGFAIPATAQNSSGRAAIFIACIKQGADYTVSKMRLSGITVQGNAVNNSAVNGILLYNIDSVNLKDNKFINGNSGDNSQTGNIIEIQNCTAINVLNNTVIDNRNSVLHKRAYAIENSSGNFQKGIVGGYKTEAVSTRDSRLK